VFGERERERERERVAEKGKPKKKISQRERLSEFRAFDMAEEGNPSNQCFLWQSAFPTLIHTHTRTRTHTHATPPPTPQQMSVEASTGLQINTRVFPGRGEPGDARENQEAESLPSSGG